MHSATGPVSPAVSAHQGGTEDAPGGTWQAYQCSIDTGAEYVELDIRRTADGALVVFHDNHVTTRSGPPAPIDRLSHAALTDLAGYRVPLVDEVLELIAGKAMGHLDLKDIGYEEEVISLALNVLGSDNFLATTLEDVSVARIRRRFPQVRAGLSLGRDLSGHGLPHRVAARLSELFPMRRIRACGADRVAVHHRLATATVLATCARHGISAMVWTVNDEPAIDRFLTDPRVEVLITDRPRLAVRRRRSVTGGG